VANNNYTKQDLEKLVCEVMGISTITPLIRKHINSYVLIDKMSYKEIARCIVWYTEVFKGKCEPLYGLGFVASVRERAAKYFKQLELDQQEKRAQANKLVAYQENNIIFNIKSLKHKKRQPKQLDINDINIEGDRDD